jgi:hypothetical protein
VLVHRGGVSEGPMDQIHGVPVRARKNYFSYVDSKKIDSLWILAQGLRVCVSWYQSHFLSLDCRKREPEEEQDRVLNLYGDCSQIRNSQ